MSSSVPTRHRRWKYLIKSGPAARVIAWTCLVFGVSAALQASAQTESVFVNFTGAGGSAPGENPFGNSLIQASDGNYYGTTTSGGLIANCFPYGCGVIYKISPVGTYTVLYSFLDPTTDGSAYNSLVEGTNGNFYGTTYNGGPYNCADSGVGTTESCGTVFRITSTGTFTLLHSFSGADGSFPSGGLVEGTDGDFYGTTDYGGGNSSNCSTTSAGCGTVFKVTPTGSFTLLHSFSGLDGTRPLYPLVQGDDGSFYGTTYEAGSLYVDGGTIYKITSAGDFTLLYTFAYDPTATIGDGPDANLVEGADGSFYGTTAATVFKVTSSGSLTPLHSFGEIATDGGYGAGY